MSIDLRASSKDVFNLVVAKGGNFLLTAVLFATVARRSNLGEFAQFGYWWSIAVMIGGVLLGGASAALVRAASVRGSLVHLRRSGQIATGLFLTLIVAWVLVVAWQPSQDSALSLFIAVAGFGVIVQAQTAALTLLRAAQATRAVVTASAVVVLIVPCIFLMLSGTNFSLPTTFITLVVAYTFGSIAAGGLAFGALRHLFVWDNNSCSATRGFMGNTLAFTAVNVFSYSVVNIDFTIFRQIGRPEEFAVMAAGKVFFERFILPALLVYVGAISLAVLRHPSEGQNSPPKLLLSTGWRTIGGVLMVLGVTVIGYRVFSQGFKHDRSLISWPWVMCAALGYFVYALNSILLDVLVIRRNVAIVLSWTCAFMLLTVLIQYVAIREFGIPGWAGGWLLVNALVFLVLAREGLTFRNDRAAAVA